MEFITTHAQLIFDVALAILLLVVLFFELRFIKATKGKGGEELRKHIQQILTENKELGRNQEQMHTQLAALDTRLQGAVRGVGLVKFNPFAGSGSSKPSFALTLLSESGDGIIISTLHARESISLFSKNVANFTPESEVTDEERKALEKARDSLHTARQ